MTAEQGRGLGGRAAGRSASPSGRHDNHREIWLSEARRAERSGVPSLTVVLCYPSTYSLGMSNLGFQTALRLFLEEPDVVCERAFWATPPQENIPGALAIAPGEPVARTTSLESGTPLSEFDVLAFSVSFEDDYLNLAAMLGAAGVPLRASERGSGDPLVVMGGMCAHMNPEPVAPLLDAVLVGEARALVKPFVASVLGSRGRPRQDRLRALANEAGAYVPSLYALVRGPDGRGTGFDVAAGAPFPVRPAASPAKMAESIVLSDGAYFSDMFLVEASRGCARGCRFCAAGSILTPRRLYPAEVVLASIEDAARHAGRERAAPRAGLVTAALLDHPEVDAILEGIARMGVELNISSIRADGLSEETARLLVACGVRSATLAPETGDEELRRIIGKPVSNRQVLSAVASLARAGMGALKLYFMIGLPGEDERDIRAILPFTREVREVFLDARAHGPDQAGGARVSVSVSPFVPKPRTPFQWMPMAGEKYIRDAMSALRGEAHRKPAIDFSGSGPREARREGLLARGGRELAEALVSAAVGGVSWRSAVKEAGVDEDATVGERARDEVFPWEAVEVGPPRASLLASHDVAVRLIGDR